MEMTNYKENLKAVDGNVYDTWLEESNMHTYKLWQADRDVKLESEDENCCWQTTPYQHNLSDKCKKTVTLTAYQNHSSNSNTDM